MSEKKTYNLLFSLVALLLLIIKWHDFYLPYFWDELGVYSGAVSFQRIHGISLMPGSVPPDLSRGHPLFFTCVNALVARVFGSQIFVAHVFCFFISVLLLLAVYLKTSKYFNSLTGLASVVIITVQPLFLAQSCFVLPEITLTLFIFLAICSYYENSFFLFALFASLAILTKEAAIVLPASVLAYSIIKWGLLKIKSPGFKSSALFLTLVPYAVFGLFLIAQKWQNGWYFFPLHIGFVKFDLSAFLHQAGQYKHFILRIQGRTLLTLIFITGCFFSLLKAKWARQRIGNSFVLILLSVTLAFFCFNSLVDFYMDRYAMVLLISFALCTSAALVNISDNRFFVTGLMLLITITGFQNMEDNIFHYDADLGYRREVNTLQQSINYILKMKKNREEVIGNFPANVALFATEGGYLNGKEVDRHNSDNNTGSYYLLLCDPGDDYQIDTSNSKAILLKTFKDRYANSSVYFVKNK